ncbi:MAG: hypothetical protein PGN29_18760 [Gordonia paraffinivorans]
MSASLSRPGRSATGAVVGGLGIAAMALVRSTVATRRVRAADDVSTRTPYTVVLEVASDADRRRRTDGLRRVVSAACASTGGHPRVIAVVAAQVGAVAATAELASSLARELGSPAAPSLLVRTDTRRVSGPSSGRGFLDVLAHVDADLDGVTSHRDDGVWVVGAGNRALDPAGVVTPDAVSSFYEDARGRAATVVVEAAPVTEFPEAQIICGLADTVVTVIDPRTATVDEVTRTHLLLTHAGAEVGPAVVMGAGRLPSTADAPGESRSVPDSPAVGDAAQHDVAAIVTGGRSDDTRDARDVATAERGSRHDAEQHDGGGPDEMENTEHDGAARIDLAAEQESAVNGDDTAGVPGENVDRSAPDPVDRADEFVPPVLTWKPRPSAAVPSTRSRLARVLGRSTRQPLGETRRTGRGLIDPVVPEPAHPAAPSEPRPTQPVPSEVLLDDVDETVTETPVAEQVADDEGGAQQIPEPEAVVEPEPEAVVEPEPEAVVEPEPEAVVEPEPEAVVEPEPEAVVEPEPEAVVDPEPAAPFDGAAPHAEDTPAPVAADGAVDEERDRVVRDRWEQELLARQRWIVEQQTQEHQREQQRAEELAKRRRVVADREARFRKEREEAAREEALRIDRERSEQARVEQLERERFARAVAERERLERIERDRVAHLEHERRARAQAARERLAREQRAREERAAMEEAALARAEAERVAAERAEAMRLAAERAEANRLAAERAEAERIAAERRAEERREAQRRLEAERAARDEQRRHLALQQQAAREQWAQEQWAQYRLAQDRWLEEQWARYRVEQRQWLQRLAAGVDLPPPAPPSPTPVPPLPMNRAVLPVVDATVHDDAGIPPR